MSLSILVLDDEPDVLRAVLKAVNRRVPAVGCSSLAEARRALAGSARWSGFIIDLGLGTGSGWDLLVELREQRFTQKALVLTGTFERGIAARAYRLGAGYIDKPFESVVIEQFADEAVAWTRSVPTIINNFVRVEAPRHDLSVAEANVLEAALNRRPIGEMLDGHFIAAETHRSHTRQIKKKFGASDFDRLVADLLLVILSQAQPQDHHWW